MIENQKRNELWDELKLLQSIIDKFDDIAFRVKNWFLTIFMAITGYAIVNNKPGLLVFNFAIIFIFYIYETSIRVTHGDFLKRFRDVQEILRTDSEGEVPYIDKYFFEQINIPENSTLSSLQKRLGIGDRTIMRNMREYGLIMNKALIYLFQLRISLIYIAAILANIAVLIFI
jgi:hypothetical protein